MTAPSADIIGVANYRLKRDFRRVDDYEMRGEGYNFFRPNTSIPLASQPLFARGVITLVHEVKRPNRERCTIVGTQTTLYRYYSQTGGGYYDSDYYEDAADYFNDNPGEWVVIGRGFSTSGERWQAVDINGYVVLNNQVDLPVSYRVEDLEVLPIWELRETGVASVGVIAELDTYLACLNVRQIKAVDFPGVMALLSSQDTIGAQAYSVSSSDRRVVASIAAGTTIVEASAPIFNPGSTDTAATGVLTHDGTAPEENATVTIGAKQYRFTTVYPLAQDGDVIRIAGNAFLCMLHLSKAINYDQSTGGQGIEYNVSGANADVSSGGVVGATITVTARTLGDDGNLVATTEASAHLSWGAATLTGGVTGHVGKYLRFINQYSPRIVTYYDSTHVEVDAGPTQDIAGQTFIISRPKIKGWQCSITGGNVLRTHWAPVGLTGNTGPFTLGATMAGDYTVVIEAEDGTLWASGISTVTDFLTVTLTKTPPEAFHNRPFVVYPKEFLMTLSGGLFTFEDSMAEMRVVSGNRTRTVLAVVDSTHALMDTDFPFFGQVQIENPAAYEEYTGPTDGIGYRVLWGAPDQPRRFFSSCPCVMAQSDKTVYLAYPLRSLSVGDEVVIVGAGINGGNLTTTINLIAGTKIIVADASSTAVGNTGADDVQATGTLTNDGTVPAENDTVTIGSAVYRFTTSFPSSTIGDVLRLVGNPTACLQNLVDAINYSTIRGGQGVQYNVPGANALASATGPAAGVVTITAIAVGQIGNTVTTAESSAHLVWGAQTLTGGISQGLFARSDAIGVPDQFFDMQDDGSAIIDAKKLKTALVIYRETSIFLMTPSQRNDQPFDFDGPLYGGQGRSQDERSAVLAFPGCVANAGQRGDEHHLYPGKNDFFRFDLVNLKPMVSEVLHDARNLFHGQVAPGGNAFAVTNENTREVWWCMPDNQGPDKVLRFDYLLGTGSTSSMKVTAASMVSRPLCDSANVQEDWMVMAVGDLNTLVAYGLVTGDVIGSYAITAAQAGLTVTASDDLFEAWHVGRTIVFDSGETCCIAEYVSALVVTVFPKQTVASGPFTILPAAWHRIGVGYESELQGGWNDFGIAGREKDLTVFSAQIGEKYVEPAEPQRAETALTLGVSELVFSRWYRLGRCSVSNVSASMAYSYYHANSGDPFNPDAYQISTPPTLALVSGTHYEVDATNGLVKFLAADPIDRPLFSAATTFTFDCAKVENGFHIQMFGALSPGRGVSLLFDREITDPDAGFVVHTHRRKYLFQDGLKISGIQNQAKLGLRSYQLKIIDSNQAGRQSLTP